MSFNLRNRSLLSMEATEAVLAPEASVEFDQGKNRMYPIKALRVATLGK